MSAEISSENQKLMKIAHQVYFGINTNSITEAIKDFHPEAIRVEPEGFPMSGTFQGIKIIHEHFTAARKTWESGSCTPEKLTVKKNKVAVFVYLKVKLKTRTELAEGRLVDVFTFENGQIIKMETFATAELAQIAMNSD